MGPASRGFYVAALVAEIELLEADDGESLARGRPGRGTAHRAEADDGEIGHVSLLSSQRRISSESSSMGAYQPPVK